MRNRNYKLHRHKRGRYYWSVSKRRNTEKAIDLFDSLPYKRSQRVSDSIKKEVASIFLFKVNDPRLRNITITKVVLSDDLSNAKIFYSTINLNDEEASVKKALDKSKGFIRTMLGKSISLKKIPTISFFKDDI